MRGQVQADLLGGSLVAQGGAGQLTAKSEDTSVRVVAHRGVSTVQGLRSTIELRELANFSRVTLDTRDSQVTAADSLGIFMVQQSSGTFDGRDLRGSMQIAARADATVELSNIDGKVGVEGEESQFTLAQLPRAVEISVNQSVLQLQEIGTLTIQGTANEITGGEIVVLRKLEVIESAVDLDLAKVQGRVAMSLKGDSDAKIELASPCVVHIVGGNESERVDVSGCHLQAHQLSGARNAHISRSLRVTTTLSVTLDNDVSLSVRGR